MARTLRRQVQGARNSRSVALRGNFSAVAFGWLPGSRIRNGENTLAGRARRLYATLRTCLTHSISAQSLMPSAAVIRAASGLSS